MPSKFVEHPIKPSSKIINISDVVIFSTKKNGPDLGAYIYWKEYGSLSEEFHDKNKIRIGDSFYAGPQSGGNLSGNEVVSIKSINNPNTGLDEIISINSNGSVSIFCYAKESGDLIKGAPQQLPKSSSGIYYIIDYVHHAKYDKSELLVAFNSNGNWYITPVGGNAKPLLDFGNCTAILGSCITQHGLGQRINFWIANDKIEDKVSHYNSFAHSYKHKVISYDIADFYSIFEEADHTATALELLINDKIVIDFSVKQSCVMQGHAIRQESNDEQLIICFLTNEEINTQVIAAIEVKEEKEENVISLITTKYISNVSRSTLSCQDILLFHRPEKKIFIMPCHVGGGESLKLAVNALTFDEGNNTFVNLSHNEFNILNESGSRTAMPIGTASFLRMKSINLAEIILFVKFYSSKLNIVSIKSDFNYDDKEKSISWHNTTNGSVGSLPVWINTDENFNPDHDLTSQVSMFALKTDLVGDSVILGAPKFNQALSFGQVFALYQAVPFESTIISFKPQISMSFNSSGQVSNDVITHSNVINNINESLTVSVWGNSLNAHFSDTWSTSKVSHLGNSSSSDLSTSITVSQNDVVHLSSNSYNIWIYPIYKKSDSSDKISEITIISPTAENVITFIPTTNKNFFYNQDYEVGMLLSYLNAEKNGFCEKALLFHPESLPVLGDKSSISSISYLESNTTLANNSITKDVTLSAGAGLTLNANFGNVFSINNSLSFSHTDSSGNSSSNSYTLTKGFHLNFNLGNVSDDIYQYQITPLVFHQKDTNVLMVKYDVELTGSQWHKYFADPKPVLFRVFPFSEDILEHAYTRSIRFTPLSDTGDKASLSILIFNNSMSPLEDFTCKIFSGVPSIDNQKQLSTDKLSLISEYDVQYIDAASYKIFDLHQIVVEKNSFITIELIHESLFLKNKRIYWSAYPYDASKDS